MYALFAQVTPDLLKGQEELSQQTNEETAKQILFSYLKDGWVHFSDHFFKHNINKFKIVFFFKQKQ